MCTAIPWKAIGKCAGLSAGTGTALIELKSKCLVPRHAPCVASSSIGSQRNTSLQAGKLQAQLLPLYRVGACNKAQLLWATIYALDFRKQLLSGMRSQIQLLEAFLGILIMAHIWSQARQLGMMSLTS